MNSVIIIPSYNSNSSLFEVINKINNYINKDIIVVDDGSIEAFQATHLSNVQILRNTKNRGKGFSLQKGFKYAQGRGYSHAITLDADMQHSPKEIKNFIDAKDDAEFVLGYRQKNASMPFHRKLSNGVTTFIISKLTQKKIFDSQCGYRRYNLNLVNAMAYKEEGFQFESEVLIKCINKDTLIKQLPIETIYDKNNKSYIRHVSDTLKFVRLIIRSFIKK